MASNDVFKTRADHKNCTSVLTERVKNPTWKSKLLVECNSDSTIDNENSESISETSSGSQFSFEDTSTKLRFTDYFNYGAEPLIEDLHLCKCTVCEKIIKYQYFNSHIKEFHRGYQEYFLSFYKIMRPHLPGKNGHFQVQQPLSASLAQNSMFSKHNECDSAKICDKPSFSNSVMDSSQAAPSNPSSNESLCQMNISETLEEKNNVQQCSMKRIKDENPSSSNKRRKGEEKKNLLNFSSSQSEQQEVCRTECDIYIKHDLNESSIVVSPNDNCNSNSLSAVKHTSSSIATNTCLRGGGGYYVQPNNGTSNNEISLNSLVPSNDQQESGSTLHFLGKRNNQSVIYSSDCNFQDPDDESEKEDDYDDGGGGDDDDDDDGDGGDDDDDGGGGDDDNYEELEGGDDDDEELEDDDDEEWEDDDDDDDDLTLWKNFLGVEKESSAFSVCSSKSSVEGSFSQTFTKEDTPFSERWSLLHKPDTLYCSSSSIRNKRLRSLKCGILMLKDNSEDSRKTLMGTSKKTVQIKEKMEKESDHIGSRLTTEECESIVHGKDLSYSAINETIQHENSSTEYRELHRPTNLQNSIEKDPMSFIYDIFEKEPDSFQNKNNSSLFSIEQHKDLVRFSDKLDQRESSSSSKKLTSKLQSPDQLFIKEWSKSSSSLIGCKDEEFISQNGSVPNGYKTVSAMSENPKSMLEINYPSKFLTGAIKLNLKLNNVKAKNTFENEESRKVGIGNNNSPNGSFKTSKDKGDILLWQPPRINGTHSSH